jgi:hypothetical protein
MKGGDHVHNRYPCRPSWRNSRLVGRSRGVRTPEPEGRWKPVKHSLIVDLMHEELARRDITVAKEE